MKPAFMDVRTEQLPVFVRRALWNGWKDRMRVEASLPEVIGIVIGATGQTPDDRNDRRALWNVAENRVLSAYAGRNHVIISVDAGEVPPAQKTDPMMSLYDECVQSLPRIRNYRRRA